MERVPIALPSSSTETEEISAVVPEFHNIKKPRIVTAAPIREISDIDHSELIAGDFPTSQSLIQMTKNLPRVETRDIPLDEELGNFEANHVRFLFLRVLFYSYQTFSFLIKIYF